MGVMRWLAERLGGAPTGGGGSPGGAATFAGPGRQLVAHEVPRIQAHWEEVHVAPILHELGVADTATFFAEALRDAVRRTGNERPRFLSLGAGSGQLKLRLAKAFAADGLGGFLFECVETNPLLRSRPRAAGKTGPAAGAGAGGRGRRSPRGSASVPPIAPIAA